MAHADDPPERRWSEGDVEAAYVLYPSTQSLPFEQDDLASQSDTGSEDGSDSSSLPSSGSGSRNGLPESDNGSNSGSNIPDNGHRKGSGDNSSASANGADHDSVQSLHGQHITGDRTHDQAPPAADASSRKKGNKKKLSTRNLRVTKKEVDETSQGLTQTDVDRGLALVRRLKEVYQEKGGVLELNEPARRVSVNFAEFARATFESLQSSLVEKVLDFVYRDEMDARSAARELSAYVALWKDIEFMTDAANTKEYDPFAISTDLTMQRDLLRDVYHRFPGKHTDTITAKDQFDQDKQFLTDKLGEVIDEERVVRVGNGTRTENNEKRGSEQYARKVAMAIVGGAFLIFPMLVMVLHPGLVTSLVTTSVCVFAFGLLMSSSVALQEPFDVLSATAAYAAVLVVFIGTGGGS